MIYVGIDWGDKNHRVFITDDTGERLDSFSIEHSLKGVESLFEQVRKFAKEQKEILFGLETSKGILVNSILEKGYIVYALNPKCVDRYRDRYKASKIKDDGFDAMVIANILRTDRQNYKPILPDSELTRELRLFTRDHQKLIRMKTMILNQLTACLKEYYPVALKFFSDLALQISIAFLKNFPTLEEAREMSKEKWERFLSRHHYPGVKEKACEIYEKLKESQFNVEPLIIRAKSQYMLSLIKQLELLLSDIKSFDDKIKELLEKHQDKEIFISLPGAGANLAARMISEFGDSRDRYKKVSSVQAEAGTAPITKASGEWKSVYFRRACRKSFRNTMQQFSLCSIKESEWAKNRYKQYIATGKEGSHALRCLGNAWLEIIFPMWKNHSPYSEQRHLLKYVKEQRPVNYLQDFSCLVA